MKNISTNIQMDANGWCTHSMDEINDSFASISDGIYKDILKAMPFYVDGKQDSKNNFNKYDSLRTKEIKTCLTILGHKKHFRVYTNALEVSKKQNKEYQYDRYYFKKRIEKGCDRFVGKEWLFDLIWYKEWQDGENELKPCKSEEGYLVKSMDLVIESEWGGIKKGDKNHDVYGEVKYDFQKLVVANAEHRVMVFKDQGDNLEKITQYIKAQIDLFPMKKDDTILCVAYNKDYSDFRYRLFKKN